MKTTLCTILLLFLFASVPLCAQGRADSMAPGPRRPVSTGPSAGTSAATGVAPTGSAPAGHPTPGFAGPGPAATTSGFIDRNGDGIDDRATENSSGIRRGKDRFIDEDGDGICDMRASGLGIRQRGAGAGLMMGADGKGKMRPLGSGGKP